MNIVFYLMLIIGAVILWGALCFTFKLTGGLFHAWCKRIKKELSKNEINKEELKNE